MKNLPIDPDHLELLLSAVRPYAKNGSLPTYIPALKEVNPMNIGCAIFHEGQMTSAGEANIPFTLQSISKVLSLSLALMDQGEETVFSKVGMEPTRNPFNSIEALEEEKPTKPLNPMINAGALVVADLINGMTNEEKVGRLLTFIHELTGNTSIDINKDIARSEWENADLNKAIVFFLKSHHVLEGNMEALLDVYIKQCSIQVTCEDLARIGSVFGNRGKDPETGRSIVPPKVARIVNTFMVTCGMYNASGEFAIKSGIPTKSGVSGSLLSALPVGIGIGVYSPPLDEKGNSAAGVKLLEVLSEKYQLSVF